MATRVTLHLIEVTQRVADEEVDNSVIVPHIDGGSCSVIAADFMGMVGNEKRFMLNVITLEPMDDKKSKGG